MLSLDHMAVQIRERRKLIGYSQTKLGSIANVSRAQIDRLENGRASDMGFIKLLRILRALDLDLTLGSLNYGRPTLGDLREDD